MKYIVEEFRTYLINKDGNVLAYVTHPKISDTEYVISHTFVDYSLRGQGIAAKLMEMVYNQIKSTNLKAIAQCSYAQKWFIDHPEKQDILK